MGQRRGGGPAPRRLHALHLRSARRRRARRAITIVVRARDDHRPPQPRGKQSQRYGAYGASTPAPPASGRRSGWSRCRNVRFSARASRPDVANGLFRVAQPITGSAPGLRLRVTLKDDTGHRLHDRAPGGRRLRDPCSTCPSPPSAAGCGRPTIPISTTWRFELLDANGTVIDQRDQLRRAAQRHHRRQGDQDQRQAGLPAPGARPGLLPGRHPDRAQRRGPAPRYRAGSGGRLQRRAAAPEGLRGALPLPRRPAGLPGVGRIRRLGLPHHGGPDDDHQQPDATYITQWLEALERDYSHPASSAGAR